MLVYAPFVQFAQMRLILVYPTVARSMSVQLPMASHGMLLSCLSLAALDLDK